MRRLVLATALTCACGGEPRPDVQDPTEVTANGGQEGADRAAATDCPAAQRAEVDAWIAEMVTSTDDELEMWTALGMVMTLTDPEVLTELGETMPEASDAIAKSRAAWDACHELVVVNCAALDRALDVTEARVGEKIWDRADITSECMGGKVDAEAADCALAANDVETAKSCFAGA